MLNKKILLISTDNHTLGIQTVANIVLKKKNIEPEMFYLSSNLPKYPHSTEAKILHHIIREVDEAEEKVLIGFQLKELNLGRSIQLANKIKRYRSDKVRLVAGGTYATAEPLALLDIFDYVVVGGGDGILKVFDAVFEEKSINPIAIAPPIGFEYPLFTDCWVLNEYGKIAKRRLRPLIHPQYKITKALEIMLGFGCSYSCSYCEAASLRKIFGSHYKISFAEPEQAIALMKNEIDLDQEIKYIYFFDEDFLLKLTDWNKKFSSLYRETIGLPFFIFATPSSVRNFPHKILTLSKAGLDTVNMGIQSGSEEIAKNLFGRRESKDEIKTCVDFLTKLYLQGKTTSPPVLDFIILNPYETVGQLLETVQLIMELPTPFNAIMHCMSFFRGTPLYKKATDEDIIPKGYRFRCDLHDFMSRVRENELKLDYSKEESCQWLFLNVLLYGMGGIHRVCKGLRRLGSLTKTQLELELSLLNRVTYDDIISMAFSLPNPIDELYFNWEINEKPITQNLILRRKKDLEVLNAPAVNA